MSRRLLWALVGGVVVATLLVLWFQRNFEQVPVKRHVGAQAEARRNPLLAFERTLATLGRPVTRIKSPAALDALAPGGVLILDGNRRRGIGPQRAARLLDWVAAGGYLILAGEWIGDDPLLARFGVSSTCRASFALYNTFEEVDALADALERAKKLFV